MDTLAALFGHAQQALFEGLIQPLLFALGAANVLELAYAATGSHNYTASKAENDSLVTAGWRAEGVAWYGVKR